MPCQDYTEFIRLNNGEIVIGAVSDGGGIYKYSDVGSKLAVETALNSLQLWSNSLKKEDKLSRKRLKYLAKKVFATTLKKVKEAFNEKARKMSCSPKDFSCTLLVVVATPNWLAAMQIGDGFIVVRQPESKYQLLFHPSKGEYFNETTFVTSSSAERKMQVKTLFGKQQFIFAASDGLEKIAINLKNWQPHPPFFYDFEKALETRTENEEKLSTEDWLKSEDVNERTDDDKTILLFWYEYSESGESPSPPKAKKHNIVILFDVLSGSFWNSLYHDLFVDSKFKSSTFNLFISFFIAAVLTVIIVWFNFYIYQPIKSYNSQFQREKALINLLIISSLGLSLGGALYYSIREYIFSYLS